MGTHCVKLHFSEEQKADDEAFETHLVAERLQEQVVRVELLDARNVKES